MASVGRSFTSIVYQLSPSDFLPLFHLSLANEDEAFYKMSQKRRIFSRRIGSDLRKMAGKRRKDENERTGLGGISK